MEESPFTYHLQCNFVPHDWPEKPKHKTNIIGRKQYLGETRFETTNLTKDQQFTTAEI